MSQTEVPNYAAENAARYSKIANDYGKDWRGELTPDLIEKYDAFLGQVGEPPKTILDIGCGTGKASLYFANNGYTVHCLDLSTGMLTEALSHAGHDNLIDSTLANMKEIPIADNSVDGLWTMAAVVHLPPADRAIAIGEFARVLKPDGIMCLSVQNRLSTKHIQRIFQSFLFDIGYDEHNRYYQKPKKLSNIMSGQPILQRLIDGYAYLDERHWYFPTAFELTRAITKCGLTIADVSPVFGKRIDIIARKST